MDTNTLYAILGVSAMIMIIVGIVFFSRLKASVSKDGIQIEGEKTETPYRQIVIEKVEGAKIEVTNSTGQNINVQDVSGDADIKAK